MRNKALRKALSAILAVSMTVSNLSPAYMNIYAAETEMATEMVTEAVKAEQSQDDTNKVETQTPPETQAETQAPETQAAPAETEAQAVPESTVSPESQAPQATNTTGEQPASEQPQSSEQAQPQAPADVPSIKAESGPVSVSVENLDYSEFPEGVSVEITVASDEQKSALASAWMNVFENEYMNEHKNLTAEGQEYVRKHMKEHVYGNGFKISVTKDGEAYDKEIYVNAKISDKKLSSGIAEGNPYHVGFHDNGLELQSDMKDYFKKGESLGLTFTDSNGWYSVVMRDKSFSVSSEYFVEDNNNKEETTSAQTEESSETKESETVETEPEKVSEAESESSSEVASEEEQSEPMSEQITESATEPASEAVTESEIESETESEAEPEAHTVYFHDSDEISIDSAEETYTAYAGEIVSFTVRATELNSEINADIAIAQVEVAEDETLQNVSDDIQVVAMNSVEDESSVYEEVAFIMPDSDVAVTVGTNLLYAKIGKATLTNYPSAYTHPDYASGEGPFNYTVRRDLSVPNTDLKKMVTYCCQGLGQAAGNGTYTLHSLTEYTSKKKLDGITSQAEANTLAKYIYYCVGGPGEAVTKEIFKGNEIQQYAMCHFLLQHVYASLGGPTNKEHGWNWNSNGLNADGTGYNQGHALNDAGYNAVIKAYKTIKNLSIPTTSLSTDYANSTYANGVGTSDTIVWSCTGVTGNSLTFKVPKGVTCHVSNGKTFTSPNNKRVEATVPQGGSFYFTKSGYTTEHDDTIEVTGKIVTDYQAYYVDLSNNYQNMLASSDTPLTLSIHWVVSNDVPVSVSKTSANPEITSGNGMYSFAGATFVLSNATNSYTFVCDANGNSAAQNVALGTYTLTETVAPAGYKVMAPRTEVISESRVISVADEPIVARLDLPIRKIEDVPRKPLSDAWFKVSYYSNTTWTGSPVREWVLKTIQEGDDFETANYYARNDAAHLVSGSPYSDFVIPLGSITITEIKEPAGFIKSNAVIRVPIIEDGTKQDLSAVNYNEDYANFEEKYGKILLDKSSIYQGQIPDGDATFAGAEFTITNLNPYAVSKNNDARNNEQRVDSGAVADVIVTNEDGEGMSVFLQAGTTYHIEETKAPEGYTNSGWSMDVTIPDIDNHIVDLRGEGKILPTDGYGVTNLESLIPNTPIEGGFHLEKHDLELDEGECSITYEGSPVFYADSMFGENGAQGDATLDSAVFALYNISQSSVSVLLPGETKRKIFEPNEKIFEFKTSGSVYESSNDFLSYGTYRIEEIKPSKGYKIDEKSVPVGKHLTMEFEIRNQGEIVTVGKDGEPLVAKDDVKRFDIEIRKELMLHEVESAQLDENNVQNELQKLIGVQFDITLQSNGRKYATITTQPVYDEEGNIIDVYASTVDPAYPHGRLPYGVYVIHEVEGTFPEDYLPIADEICDGRSFVDGYKKLYNFKDYPKEEKIQIVKFDAERGTYIPLQATFQILDENKNMIKSLGRDNGSGTWVEKEGVWKAYEFVDDGEDGEDKVYGEWITEFKTDENGCAIIPGLLPYGTYYLHEVEAPYGYLWAEDKKFQVTERPGSATYIQWRFGDKPVKGRIQIKKSDANTKELIDGAEFDIFAEEDIITGDGTLRYSKDDKVDHIVIGNKEHGVGESKDLFIGIRGDAGIGRFYAVETKAPEGYALSDEVLHFELKYVDQNTPVVYDLEEMENEPTILSIKKVEMVRDDSAKEWKPGKTVEDGSVDERKSLSGITFKITRIGAPEMDRYNNDNVYTGGVHTTNDDGIIINTHIASGLYSIQEIKTRPGYVLDDTIRYFVVDKDGFIAECDSDGTSLITEADKSLALIWENQYTTWYFSKVDVNGDNEIAGAHMQILDGSGKVAEYDDGNGGTAKAEWVSDGTTKYIPRLPVGGYTLVETQAPEGYCIAVEMPFEVTNDAIVHKETMVDKQVSMSKTDVTGSKEIPGAKITVKHVATDEVVDSWTSGEEPHLIKNLRVGETYSLTEELAPNGYCIAETIQFVVHDDKKNQPIKMRDKILYIDKKDALGGSVVGADFSVFALTKKDDGTFEQGTEAIDSFTTDGKPHVAIGLSVGHWYRLVETKAPEGYVKAEPFDFYIANDYQDQTVVVVDKQHFVCKTDTNVTDLKGAELCVKEKESGKIVDSWVSDGSKEGHAVSGLEQGHTYILMETKAPEGYVIAAPVEFTVSKTAENNHFTLKNKQVMVSKQDITTCEEIADAKLTVFNYNAETKEIGDVVDTWTSVKGERHAINGLEVEKTYLLREETAPAGYVKAEDIVFYVENDFTVQTVVMKDDYTKWDFTKADVTYDEENDKEVPYVIGAILTIKDLDGNVYEEWVTEAEPHRVERIPVGTYTLTETQLPGTNGLGYVTAETITFEVTETGVVQSQVMKDEFTKVQITKSDITDSKPVPGAILTIRDKDGNIVEEWVTEEEPHYIERLPIGTYTLTETQLPGTNGMGYVTAETITFEVRDTPEIQKVDMIDDFTKVQITKSDITTSKPVVGATLTIRDADGNVYAEWVTTEEPHYIERMPIGTYTLTETQLPGTNGLGYVTAETITFRVEDTPEIQKVDMKDDFTKLQITKSDIATSKPVIGATLTITDETGKVVAEWVTEKEPHYIERLPIGTYTLTETQTPGVNGMGYVTSESITFKIEDTPEIQKVDMVDDFTKLEISKSDITDGEPVIGAILEIIDADGNQVDTWETTEEPYYIERLPVGKYQLSERIPADGYATAETIEFVIDDTPEIQKVEMFDERTKVEISKADITDGKPVIGAKLVIKDSDGEEVESWTTEKEPHYIEMLPIGVYTLTEITAPQGYEVAETIKFEVEDTGEIQKVVMYDKPSTPPGESTNTPSPQTGDTLDVQTIIWIVVIVLVLLGCGGYFIMKGKKKKDSAEKTEESEEPKE